MILNMGHCVIVTVNNKSVFCSLVSVHCIFSELDESDVPQYIICSNFLFCIGSNKHKLSKQVHQILSYCNVYFKLLLFSIDVAMAF